MRKPHLRGRGPHYPVLDRIVQYDFEPGYVVFTMPASKRLRVKAGDTVKVGATLAKIGNTGPSFGPHLHFGLLNRPDIFTGRSLPFVIDSYTLAGTVDFKTLQGDTLAVTSNSKQVRSVYPLHGTVQNYP